MSTAAADRRIKMIFFKSTRALYAGRAEVASS